MIDSYASVVLRDRLCLEEDIISILPRNRLWWHGHVSRKDEGERI